MQRKKNFFKFLSTLVVVILCLSLFSFHSFAASSLSFDVPIAQPNISEGYGYIEVLYNNSSSVEVLLVSVSAPDNYDADDGFITFVDSLLSVNVFSDSLSITPSSYASNQGYSIGVFYLTGHGTSGFLHGSDSPITTDYYSNINGIHLYGFHSCNYYSGFNNNTDFVVNYGSDGLANSQLNSIISILQNNNQSIIDNANQNAQQIQQNQNENTDKVLNGWDSTGKSPDTTVTDDYHSKEQEVMNNTAEARSSVVSMFNNFGSLLDRGKLTKGLLVVSRFMSGIFSIGWIADLVQFSLILGAFSFVIGSVVMVVGRFSSNRAASERRDRNNETRVLRNNYYKSRTEYYNSRRKK